VLAKLVLALFILSSSFLGCGPPDYYPSVSLSCKTGVNGIPTIIGPYTSEVPKSPEFYIINTNIKQPSFCITTTPIVTQNDLIYGTTPVFRWVGISPPRVTGIEPVGPVPDVPNYIKSYYLYWYW